MVITRFENQPAARIFKNKLERRGIRVYTHRFTKGYPTDVDLIVSDEGYGANEYIETRKPLVVVTGPGAGQRQARHLPVPALPRLPAGPESGYAKFETFPIWNLPLKHPVNVAYEAATADLRDFNLIDPFHLEAYGKIAVNYNRDVEVFPVLRRILEKITGAESRLQVADRHGRQPRRVRHRCDERSCREAARQELIRRYFRYRCEYAMGFVDKETVQRAELLMNELGLKPEDRRVVAPAREAAEEAQEQGQGQQGDLLRRGHRARRRDHRHGQELAPDARGLEPGSERRSSSSPRSPTRSPCSRPSIIDSVRHLKENILGARAVSLDLEEALICLSINAATNPAAQMAMEKLQGPPRLRGPHDAHPHAGR